MDKPARRQVDESVLKEHSAVDIPAGSTYNIWHHRWSGTDWRKQKGITREAAKFRCNISADSGFTKGSNNSDSYFCLFFARGQCPYGSDCAYWHRIPTDTDEIETTIDCFGRDRYREFRDDMGGIGGFNFENRTLYIGRIVVGEDMEKTVRKHFSEWGSIEKIKVLPNKGVAFVTYTSRSNAEFAKEAMVHQSLDNDEIINVQWATEDPDPRNKTEYKRKAENMIRQDFESHLPPEFVRIPRVEVQTEEEQYKRLKPDADYLSLADPQAAAYFQMYGTWEGYDPNAFHAYDSATYATQNLQEEKSSNNILSEEALKSLKSLAEMKELTKKEEPKGGLGNLADYGSDEED